MKNVLLTATLALGVAVSAHAECPESAIQNLYNLKLKIYAGQENDPKQVFGWASEAMRVCADSATVMGQTAELCQILGNTVTQPQDKFVAYSQAYQAIINNGKAYDNSAPAPLVKKPDGTEEKFYTYGTANVALKHTIAALADLHRGGVYSHDIFRYSYPNTRECPHLDEDRVIIEIDALRQWAERDDSKKGVALWRLEGLRVVCPKFSEKELTYTIAHMNMDRAEHHIETNPNAGLRFAELAQQYANENTDVPKQKGVYTDWTVQDHLKLKGIMSDLEQHKQKGQK